MSVVMAELDAIVADMALRALMVALNAFVVVLTVPDAFVARRRCTVV